ncbi:MAG TPA: M23 family metallopeptidase [Stellaceae bacterium]|nr:M23 family metallopeptidase [Stellaceae bacterium]
MSARCTTFLPLIAIVIAVLLASPALAGTLVLEGPVEQGSLVHGKTDSGAKVTLDGRAVRVADDGSFIFGFGRDAPAEARLDVTFADGSSAHRDLKVAARQYDIQRINGLPAQQVTPDAATLERIKREQVVINTARSVDSSLPFFERPFVWPAVGPISGVYGSQRILNGEPRAPHMGLDIAAPRGSPVLAADAGTVTLAERDLFFTGGTVIIDHGYGLATTYQHMDRIDVTVGQHVTAGQPIGIVGATGRVTGPHLHWALNWYEVRLDPALVMGPMPTAQH